MLLRLDFVTPQVLLGLSEDFMLSGLRIIFLQLQLALTLIRPVLRIDRRVETSLTVRTDDTDQLALRLTITLCHICRILSHH